MLRLRLVDFQFRKSHACELEKVLPYDYACVPKFICAKRNTTCTEVLGAT